jgi:hypothetical protein
MGCCDGTTDDELVPGADWVWNYATSDDVSGWTDEIVEAWVGTTLLASTQGDTPNVVTDGSFEEIPATDFGAGIFAWVIPSDVSIGATGSTVRVLAWAKVDGVDTQVFDRTYRLRKTPVVRDEEGS